MTPLQQGLRRGLILVVALLLIGSGLLAGLYWHGDMSPNSSVQTAGASSAEPGGPFQLTDTRGNIVTDRTLAGAPYAIFFGFTRCPDVCPTTMNRMAQLHQRLGSDASKLRIFFVSVDPEHDKAEDVASFLSMFEAPVTGLTGTDAQLAQLKDGFKIYVQRVPLPDGDYTIDHSTSVYLMDRTGRFFEPLSATEPIETNLAQLRRLIAG